MAESSNSSASTSTGASTATGSQSTTSNSNGNFSGGSLSGLSAVSSPSISLGSEAGPGYSRGDFSFSSNFGWTPSISLDGSGAGKSTNMFSGATYDSATGQTTIGGSKGSSSTSGYVGQYGDTVSVDSVFGKSDDGGTGTVGNKSVVESQGDYNATSNEKSNVETSTFGKQDTVSVTPQSVVEDKGLVANDAIDGIEGLVTQQKDKASQEVLEARKSRDEAEADDKADKTRDNLKASLEEDKEGIEKFQIGDRDEELAYADKNVKDAQAEVDNLMAKVQETDKMAQYLKDDAKEVRSAKEMLDKYSAEVEQARNALSQAKTKVEASPAAMKPSAMVKAEQAKGTLQAKEDTYNGVVTMVEGKFGKDFTNNLINAESVDSFISREQSKISELNDRLSEAQSKLSASKEAYDALVASKYVGAEDKSEEETVEETVDNGLHLKDPVMETVLAMEPANEAKSWAGITLPNEDEWGGVEGDKARESISGIIDAGSNLQEVTENLAKDENNPQLMVDYYNTNKEYLSKLEEAEKVGNMLSKTDFNKEYVSMVAKATDFDVTRADGSKVSYAQFATEMATKSPQIAKAMYEAKAKSLEEEGHTVLAKIERAKASMVQTWLGSKLTQADNQVRDQFNQMAKTNMRATYAAYNNVLNEPNASPEDKANAASKIQQANALMTASTALQASTGFLSGIGDSMKDGVYGVTDPASLNAYQKTLNAVDNFAKITLGLGVTPGANKAYQNMYYMAGAKISESGLFSKDFDGDGFALCQEYGNNAAAGMIAGAGELATGVALFFNPATAGIGLNLVVDSVQTFTNGLYGVQKDAKKSQKYTNEVISYFNDAKGIAEKSGNKEAVESISNAVTQIENFQLKADEVGNLDNYLEGSGSNTATNEKFNQSLSYDEWLKLIESDETMRNYAKKLASEKKE